MSTLNMQFSEAIEGYFKENEAFEDGNRAAGTRARKHLLALKKLANQRRLEIQATKNK